MTSKKFSLKYLLLVGVAVFLFQGITSCQKAPKEKVLGLQLYSVRDAMKKDVAGTVEKVGKMGYKYVETAGYSDGKIYGLDPVDFKNLCEKNGLQFLGAHTGQNIPTDENWDETMKWWDTCIAAHKAGGAKWIVQPWMSKVAYNSLDGLKQACKYFNAVGEKCNAAGIRFGYHNHSHEFTTIFDGKPIYDWMMELTDPEKVMFEMDVYWVVQGGKNPVDYFAKYPGRYEVLHIKDEKEVGESGEIDFAAIFAKTEQAGAKYGVVEVERYNFDPIVSCQKSFDFLNAADYVGF